MSRFATFLSVSQIAFFSNSNCISLLSFSAKPSKFLTSCSILFPPCSLSTSMYQKALFFLHLSSYRWYGIHWWCSSRGNPPAFPLSFSSLLASTLVFSIYFCLFFSFSYLFIFSLDYIFLLCLSYDVFIFSFLPSLFFLLSRGNQPYTKRETNKSRMFPLFIRKVFSRDPRSNKECKHITDDSIIWDS